MKRILWVFIALVVAACEPPAQESTETAPPEPAGSEKQYDLILTGGTIVDGLGNPGFKGDVGIKDDRIIAVSRDGLSADDAEVAVSIEGRTLSPGFIDNHSHTQTTIHKHPLAENFTRQGITTLIASLHSGDQPWPLDEYASSLEVAPNMGFFAGHSWTRTQVLGLEDRAPTDAELDEMRALVDESMRQGALGLSTGLLYVPANYAETEEVIELAKVASRHGGIYVTHMRNEGTGLLDSVNETIRIAREANIPAQINHHKAHGVGQWGSSVQSLGLIDAANEEGLDVRHDLYPYTASSTRSGILFPQWVFAGGREELAKRLTDPEQLPGIKTEMRRIFMEERTGNDLNRLQIRVMKFDPSYNGKTLADIAADRGMPNNVETGIELAIELELKGGFSAIYHAMDEEDVVRIMQHPLAMIETDGDPVAYGVGFPHPRSYGAFPRVLARYVRELQALTLEQAIMKMTSMPADQYNQPERGRIIEGAFADIVVFDPDTVRDNATFTDPHRYPTGIDHVLINGEFVIRDAALTGERPGVWIKGPSRPDRVASE